MKTDHEIVCGDSRDLRHLADNSVELIVTSPPYPMIQMWDEIFADLDAPVGEMLKTGDVNGAYLKMHDILKATWTECYRVLKPGSIMCVNIGDATRTIGDSFRLFTNHATTTVQCQQMGFHSLPTILWRKQTNAPNKFMGSGMLPAGAYVTLEHEYILVFRKPGKRSYTEEQKKVRRMSAFFWEERNVWFSDLWDLKGTRQSSSVLSNRDRTAAYPFEIPFRLINMFSVIGDTVLDPFGGTGTTSVAAAACGRNSVIVEIDQSYIPIVANSMLRSVPVSRERQQARLKSHQEFVELYGRRTDKVIKHVNIAYEFPVITRQEVDIQLFIVKDLMEVEPNKYQAEHIRCKQVTENYRIQLQ